MSNRILPYDTIIEAHEGDPELKERPLLSKRSFPKHRKSP